MPPTDLAWLGRAFDLAERGRYSVSPNPMVGAVVVRGGRVVGEGFHRRAGGPHAEILALRRAAGAARGADLYLTLEPCVPPGAHAALRPGGDRRRRAAGRRGVEGPEPARLGPRDLAALRRAGIEVVLAPASWRRRAEEQNEKFFTCHREGASVRAREVGLDARRTDRVGGRRKPLDHGRARAASGRCCCARSTTRVLVGAGTVAADDPRLTRRLGRNRATPHWRIVLDGRLRIPEDARVLRGPGRRLVATAVPAVASEGPAARRAGHRGLEPAVGKARRRGPAPPPRARSRARACRA